MPCSSIATAYEGDRALHQSTSRSGCHDREASPGKRQCRVNSHLASRDARLGEASIPVWWDGSWRRSRRGHPLWEHLLQSIPLAITDDVARQASRSATGKGDFCPNSLTTKRARWGVWHLTVYIVQESRSTRSKPTSCIIRGGPVASTFFAKQAMQRLAHCGWGRSSHISNVNPPGVTKWQAWRAIMTTTSRKMCGHHSSMK
jgi:hypothetical protein